MTTHARCKTVNSIIDQARNINKIIRVECARPTTERVNESMFLFGNDPNGEREKLRQHTYRNTEWKTNP